VPSVYNGNVAGSIVLIISNGCDYQYVARLWQAQGVAAVVSAHPDYNIADNIMTSWDHSNVSDITVPYVTVSWQYPPTVQPQSLAEHWGSNLIGLAFTGQNISFRLDFPDQLFVQTQWRVVSWLSFAKWGPFSFAVVMLTFCVARLMRFIDRDKGIKPTIHQVTFSLNIISLIFLMFNYAVGPLFLDMYMPWSGVFFLTHFLPYSLGAQYVLAFYWIEVGLFVGKRTAPVLSQLAIPAYILIFVVWVMEVAQGSLAIARVGTWFDVVKASWSFYIAASSILIIMLVFGGTIVLIKLGQAPSSGLQTRSKRIAFYMFVNLISPALIIAGTSLSLIQYYNSLTNLGTIFLIYGLAPCIAALVSVLMFDVKTTKEVDSARSKSSAPETSSSLPGSSKLNSSASSSSSASWSNKEFASGQIEL